MRIFPPTTEPRHLFHVRYEPGTKTKYKDEQDNEIVPMSIDAVPEDDMGEAIELQEGVMSNKIDH